MDIKIEYYSEKELKNIPFGSLGKKVLIKKNVSLINVENIFIGNNVRIDDNVIIVASTAKVKIGNNVHITSNCYLAGSHGIRINDFCTLAVSVLVFSGSDDYLGKKLTNPTIDKEFIGGKSGKVTFEKHVIIGANSVILPGVTIKEGSAVGALSLVNKSLESWGVYIGLPAKKIKNRSKHLLKLEKEFLDKNKKK